MPAPSPFRLPDLTAAAHHDPEDRLMVERWRRAATVVRCALHPGAPERIRLYLALGERLLREGIGTPVAMHFRMFDTLVTTALDDSLPLTWRRLCAEHLVRPTARLRTLLLRRDPAAVQALETRLESVRDRLGEDRPAGPSDSLTG